jgi:DNA-binding NarL/FixJ family response regulator
LASILLAEDDESMRRFLAQALERAGHDVTAFGDGAQAYECLRGVRFDLLLSDIVMPGLDGIAATVALRARRPGARVVLVTVHDDPDLAERGYAAGALAYVLKHTAARELVPALRAALRDERYVPPSIRGRR